MTSAPWRFGTLACMLCGTVTGTVSEGVLRVSAQSRPIRTTRGLRCPRCNGGLYLERELSGIDLPAAPPAMAAGKN